LTADAPEEGGLASAFGKNGPIAPSLGQDIGGQPRSLLPPELMQGLPQEFLDAIAPQFQVKPIKKGMNPMLVLAMGGAGMLLLLAAVGLATLLLSGR
jgi:hypothetical protein